jgi:hypothetical protein
VVGVGCIVRYRFLCGWHDDTTFITHAPTLPILSERPCLVPLHTTTTQALSGRVPTNSRLSCSLCHHTTTRTLFSATAVLHRTPLLVQYQPPSLCLLLLVLLCDSRCLQVLGRTLEEEAIRRASLLAPRSMLGVPPTSLDPPSSSPNPPRQSSSIGLQG